MSELFAFELSITGPEGTRLFHLPPGITRIGRMPECELPLDHPQVAERHAQIECGAAGCSLTDLNSETGTFLNGQRLTPGEPASWPPEGAVQIGPYQLVLAYVPAADPAAGEAPVRAAELEPAGGSGTLLSPAAEWVPGEEAVEPAPGSRSGTAGAGDPLLELLPRRSQHLIHYLPAVYDEDFMQRFLALFESILLPLEWLVDHYDLILDPGTTPAGFLPWMANWYEMARRPCWSEAQRRALIQAGPDLYARLGTAWSVRRALEIYAGEAPEIIEFANGSNGSPPPFTFTVRVPLPETQTTRAELTDLIDQLKPAHTTCILEFVR